MRVKYWVSGSKTRPARAVIITFSGLSVRVVWEGVMEEGGGRGAPACTGLPASKAFQH